MQMCSVLDIVVEVLSVSVVSVLILAVPYPSHIRV